MADRYKITLVMKVETDIITSIESERTSCDPSDEFCRELQN